MHWNRCWAQRIKDWRSLSKEDEQRLYDEGFNRVCVDHGYTLWCRVLYRVLCVGLFMGVHCVCHQDVFVLWWCRANHVHAGPAESTLG